MKHVKTAIGSAISAALVLAATTNAFAAPQVASLAGSTQWSDNPDDSVVVEGAVPAGAYDEVRVAAIPGGGFYVLSLLSSMEFASNSLLLQKVGASGALEWPSPIVIVEKVDGTSGSTLELDSQGNAVVGYGVGNAGPAKLQKVSPQGQLLWGAAGLDVSPAGRISTGPRSAVTSDDGVLVAWEDGTDTIRYQKVDSAGTLLWSADGQVLDIPVLRDNNNLVADVTATADGGAAIVVLSDGNKSSSNPSSVFAQKIDAMGLTAWGSEPVAVDLTAKGDMPAAVADGTGGVFVAWADRRGDCNGLVVLQHLDSTGQFLFGATGSAVTAACQPAENMVLEAPLYDRLSDAAYLVFSRDSGNGGPGGVGAQRFSADGVRQWGDGGVTIVPSGAGRGYEVAATLADDGIIVAHEANDGSSGTYEPILATAVSANGSLPWPSQEVVIRSSPRATVSLQGATNSGYAAFFWSDGADIALTEGDSQVLAQNVQFGGTLGN